MSVPARHLLRQAPDTKRSAFGDQDFDTFDALDVGEPIWPVREQRSSMFGASVVIALMIAAGWGILNAPADWLALLGEKVETLSALTRSRAQTATLSEASTIAVAEAPVAEPKSIADAPALPPDAQAVPGHPSGVVDPHGGSAIETAAIAGPTEPAAPQPLPPVHVDPADPYQKRAAAVGLHPDLSRVLLRKMSDADYRNARYAIDTAIAKAADGAEFVWPRQRKPEQALFRVHFVQGAAEPCRRYVVTVVKDGWSTTALPMERCGPRPKERKTEDAG